MHTWWWWYYCMCGLLLIGRCLGSVVGMGWKKEGSNRTTDDKLWVQGPLETVWVRGNCPLKLWEGSQAKILSAISAIEPISTSVQNYEWLCWEKRMEPLLVAWNLFWWHRILFIFLLLFNTSQQRHKQLTSLASWQTGTACKDVNVWKWDHFCELSLFPSFAPEMQTSCTHLRFNCVLKMWKKTIDEGSTSQQTDTRKTLKAIKMFCTLKHASWCMRFGDIIT